MKWVGDWLGRALLRIGVACMAMSSPAISRAQTAKVEQFFRSYCTDCHGNAKSKGKVTLHDFPFSPASPAHLQLWEKVVEALEGGDMPPDDEKQPTAEERRAVASWLSAELREQTRKAAAAAHVPAKARRLTNFEYENTVRDLLGLPLKLKDSLPEDPIQPYHFNNTADFMLIGPEQLDRYMECAKRALASAIQEPMPPKPLRRRVEWKADAPGPEQLGSNEIGIWGNRRRTAASGFAIENPPATGEFRLRFRASAKLPAGAKEVPLRFMMGYALDANLSTLRVAPVGTVRLKNGPEVPQEFELRGLIENFPVLPSKVDKKRTLPPVLHITPQNLYDDGTLNDDNNFSHTRNPMMPRAVLEWAEFEYPAAETWPPEAHRRILFDSPLRQSDPKAYARAVLERFLPRAFRRPPTAEEVNRFAAIFDLLLPAATSFEQAIRDTLAMVLVSPQFLYHTVADGKVVSAQDELASRLSYFLWGTMPDGDLFKLAASGQLANPATFEKQVLRMLADQRAGDFVENFTMQWLSIAKMRTVPINRELFPRFLYYVPFGERAGTEEPYLPTVRDYMIAETVGFVGELIRRNASVLNVVDSDFAMLNQRLAAHYGVPDVHGDELRPVPLKPEYQLGGMLTHGSVLIGNGTGSAPHPIYRAVWLREAILGEYVAPPPAEVPALVDSAGKSAEKALSIKDLLVQHRKVEACNDCHARLDPWGIPFEQYNAIGKFQPMVPREGTRVRAFQPKVDKTMDAYFQYLKSINTVPVAADSRLPKGPVVNGMAQLKAYLLKERADDILENVIRRLASYGLGRELTVHDRDAVAALAASAKAKGMGMRDIIVLICQSPLFQNASATK